MLFLSHMQMLGTGLAGLDAESGVWKWNTHDKDWIFQDGPAYTREGSPWATAIKDPYYNQWATLDTEPAVWRKLDEATATTLQTPMQTEPWQLKVNGIY